MLMDPAAVQVIETYERLMRGGHEVQARACLHEDFQMIEPTSLPYGGVFTGPEGFAKFRGIFVSVWSDVDRGEWDYFVNDHAVARRAMVTAVARATGRKVQWPHAEIFTVREGKIASLEVFYSDTALILSAIA